VDYDGGNPRRRGDGMRLATRRGVRRRLLVRAAPEQSSRRVGSAAWCPSLAKMQIEPREEGEMDVNANGNDEGTKGATI
jgi:hypothetical protein